MRFLCRPIMTVVGTGFLALLITMLAGGVWTSLLVANLATSPAIPWAVVAMALLLWLLWQYLGGRWWPSSTSAVRHRLRRTDPVSFQCFAWALVAGTLSLLALIGLWIVLFQLVKVPGNPLPDFSQYPWLTVALVLAMAALVAAVTEEAGFRGYFQVVVEAKVGGPLAIVISCLAIAPGHGSTQGFLWTTVLFYFLVDAMFGTLAYLTNSIVPGIVIHGVGLVLFFTVVWPQDASRRLVADGGADEWFWIHTGQTLLFAALAVLAFRQLARVTEGIRAGRIRETCSG
jgi:membrane protease YdiL (CAAX protease family)